MIRGADGLPLPYVNRDGRVLHGPRCWHNTAPNRLLSGDENPLARTRCPNCPHGHRTESNWQVVPMVMGVIAVILISTGAWWMVGNMAALALMVYGAGLWLERRGERIEAQEG